MNILWKLCEHNEQCYSNSKLKNEQEEEEENSICNVKLIITGKHSEKKNWEERKKCMKTYFRWQAIISCRTLNK